MKQLLITLFAINVLFTACKKDEEKTDTRDQFVGTYNSTLNVKVPALGLDQTNSRIYTFEKSSESGKIIVSDDLGGTMTASVSGNNYTYAKRTLSVTQGGVTTDIEITGSGSISGNTVTESGGYDVIFGGQTYEGTWTCTHVK
ncbi:MAG: hypothetical protein IPH20_19365 [Bacteroidales bacterium]|jgi:hypothetical protein|nr:hypothetical protein [Bacteroidales bacterium]